MKLINKIKEVGLKNTFIGTVKRTYLIFLRKKYGFPQWHISPFELRKYAQDIVKYVSERANKDSLIIDIGCGLGEVIANIRGGVRIGYDRDELLISLAPKLHEKEKVEFRVGSFDELCNDYEEGMTIAYIITTGFMHGEKEEYWAEYYHKVADRFNVEHFIVDTLRDEMNATHKRLDFKKILPDNYELEEKMGPFLGGRFIEVYKVVK